ncbi:ATP-binding SpoIIE family protein phosphatase [Sulfurimonas sp.]
MTKSERLKQLENAELYSSYQAELALKKELNILRNDFYYQYIDSKTNSLVDFMYKPLDVLSGDAYSARRINEHTTFYLLVDGMGKGVSASFTAVIITTFINHLVDKMIEHDSFSLEILIQESMSYMKPILLDEEVLAIDYICFDSYYNTLEYAKFAMPSFLLQSSDGTVMKIKSNNPSLSKYSSSYKTDTLDVQNIEKFLFYSDGIVENSVIDAKDTYADYIVEDFRNSFTREELKEKIFAKLSTQEDDLTLIFINTLPLNDVTLHKKKTFSATLENVDSANEWYSQELTFLCKDMSVEYKASLVFTELYMNAYEHGSLGLDSFTKHKLLENDSYFSTLKEYEKECDKKIEVKVYVLNAVDSKYLITQINDEGKGFDTMILSEIFRNTERFNGRGVFISRKNSMGIYYTSKGNSVLFLNKI